MRKSVLTDEMDKCIVTGLPREHIHHVFGGPRRKLSEQDGFIIPLTAEQHTGQYGVHNNRIMDLYFKCKCQKWYEENIGSRDDFIRRYGKSWITD